MTLPSVVDVVAEVPWWGLAASAVAVLLLVAVLLRVLVKSSWLAGVGPQAVVAMGGIAVSVHGLWGFATDTAELPAILAVAFIGVFDAAELVLFLMLYRAADPAVGWTPQLRLMHRTAWMLVAFSGTMNAIHAPTWWARPILAAVPALAAWLIELQLRTKLGALPTAENEAEQTSRPGPVRLLVLLWQRTWSALFALLGLDARTSSSAMARAALVQRAALHVYRLRLALEAGGRPRRIKRMRRRAQTSLDRADVATNPAQSLALARRLAALVRADEVAQLDYRNTSAVLAMVEELSVTDAEHTARAVRRADQAEAARQRADVERERAEAARHEAETARQRAADDLTTAREALEELREEEQAARQRAASARQDEESARQRAADARHRADEAESAAQQSQTQAQQKAHADVAALEERAQELGRLVGQLTDRAHAAQEQAEQQQTVLQQLNARTTEATVVRDRLLGELAQHTPDPLADALASGGPLFQSEAKQAGWIHYCQRLDATSGQDEPTAAELAERHGVNAGNARNWLRDFRAARAAQLTAHQPRALTDAVAS